MSWTFIIIKPKAKNYKVYFVFLYIKILAELRSLRCAHWVFYVIISKKGNMLPAGMFLRGL